MKGRLMDLSDAERLNWMIQHAYEIGRRDATKIEGERAGVAKPSRRAATRERSLSNR
jgi:hypothetical protein